MFSCPPETEWGKDDDRAWVKQNVPSLPITHDSSFAICNAFWDKWIQAKAQFPKIAMAVECGFPVETKFLTWCVTLDLDARGWDGPYPLIEIASVMASAGMDPMQSYTRNAAEEPAHNPLSDAHLSARLLATAIQKLTK